LQETVDEVNNDLETEDPIDRIDGEGIEGSKDFRKGPTQAFQTEFGRRASPVTSRVVAPTGGTGSGSPRPVTGLPPGIIPQYINSTDTFDFMERRRAGDIALRHKTHYR
jgi:hypothetical protein